MKLSPQRIAAFGTALAPLDASAFGLTELEIWPGATSCSPRSIALCRFTALPPAIAELAADKAERLLTAKLGIPIAAGTCEEGGSRLCWAEYFPGGAEYPCAQLSFQALQVALFAAAAEVSGTAAQRKAAEELSRRFESAPAKLIFVQSQFILAAARRAGLPVFNVAGDAAWQVGWGARSDLFVMTASLGDSVPGHQLTAKKHVTKLLLRELGFPTPEWRVVPEGGDALKAANELGWPCVVKPIDMAFGTGVTANVKTPAELAAAVAVARKHSRSKIIVEAHEPGADHRLMVVDGKLVGAARREPPSVTGDGKSTIGQLIAALNATRDGTQRTGYLLPVKEDDALVSLLAGQGLSTSSMLGKGKRVELRSVANFSTGGSATDVTEQVHPQVRGLAELLATSVGLRTAGIDYITPDITKPHAEAGGGFIEVNAMPRLRVLMTEEGSDNAIGAIVLGDRAGRIPVTLVIGAREDLAQRIRKHVASTPGAAAAGSKWAQVGATELLTAELDPFEIVAAALRNRAVEELVILWSPAEIDEYGVPVDQLSRAIVVDRDFDQRRLAPFCSEILTGEEADRALEGLSDA
jgi:D-alanine-D-alanine ligase-like ATP-grasp enzyme